jgi:hypothetical protein
MSPDSPDTAGRFDRWLLDAGFDPSPDALLVGRAADELSAADDSADDPWADLAAAPTLTDDQREYLVATSPELSGALPEQSLDGGDPFGAIDSTAVESADDEIIDFDDDPTA